MALPFDRNFFKDAQAISTTKISTEGRLLLVPFFISSISVNLTIVDSVRIQGEFFLHVVAVLDNVLLLVNEQVNETVVWPLHD